MLVGSWVLEMAGDVVDQDFSYTRSCREISQRSLGFQVSMLIFSFWFLGSMLEFRSVLRLHFTTPCLQA